MKKVRCIDNYYWEKDLTVGKMYKVYEIIKEDGGYFRIINDVGDEFWYNKDRFEEVKEDEMKKVRCIDASMFEQWLTKGREYEVIQEESEHYCIKDDEGHNLWYPKIRLKEIKTEKQKIAEFLIDEFDCVYCDMCDAKHCRDCCKKSHWRLSRDYAERIADGIMEIVNE